jgi:hypothetical protein
MVIAALINIEDFEVPCRLVLVSGEVTTLELEREVVLPQSFTIEISGNIPVRRECDLISQNDGVACVDIKSLPNLRSHSDVPIRNDV